MPSTKPSLQQRKLIDGAMRIQMYDAFQDGSIGYFPTILVRATMPHRKYNGRYFERVDGNLSITYADVNGIGLPYGSLPRLLMAWITTEVKINKSRRIIIEDSLNGFLASLAMSSTGGEYGSINRVKKQLSRLFSCSIGHRYVNNNNEKIETIALANKQEYWWTPINDTNIFTPNSYIELSEEFYNLIIKSSAPVDMRAMRLLQQSPMAIDIYLWLSYKMSVIKKPTAITWSSLRRQLGGGYGSDKKGLNRFQISFRKHLNKVKIVYPSANIELLRGRLLLIPSDPHVPKK